MDELGQTSWLGILVLLILIIIVLRFLGIF
jgi:hypothetical protein